MSLIQVAAGILLADGKVLLAERQGDPAFAGLWEFPGGKQEPGETSEQALARELEEELGIRVIHHSLLMSLEHQYPDRHVGIDFFLVTEWEGTPVGQQGQDMRWADIEMLGADELLPADAPVVIALKALSAD